MYKAYELLPGVLQIQDPLSSTCCTLLQGERKALLVDTGFGTENLRAFVAGLTNQPLTIILTHAHHDHILGSRWFDETWMMPDDLPYWAKYSGHEIRSKKHKAAMEKGIPIEKGFLTDPVPLPKCLSNGQTFELGGMTARVIAVPGHTPGSAIIDIPERSLVLTGDNWNPITYLFFPEVLPVQEYLRNMSIFLKLSRRYVICSHRHELFEKEKANHFFHALAMADLSATPLTPIVGWEHVNIHRFDDLCSTSLFFDLDKALAFHTQCS